MIECLHVQMVDGRTDTFVAPSPPPPLPTLSPVFDRRGGGGVRVEALEAALEKLAETGSAAERLSKEQLEIAREVKTQTSESRESANKSQTFFAFYGDLSCVPFPLPWASVSCFVVKPRKPARNRAEQSTKQH